MANHYEFRFGGSGGQGMMLMGDVMARAAGLYENEEILLTKSYGPEARGGACRSEMIVDDEPINYPAITAPNFVLAMTQLAADSYYKDLAKGGILLIDTDLVPNPPCGDFTVYSLPLTQLAVNVTGKKIAANVVAIGAIAVLSGRVSTDAVWKSVQVQFPASFEEANRKAFEAGVAAAKELLK